MRAGRSIGGQFVVASIEDLLGQALVGGAGLSVGFLGLGHVGLGTSSYGAAV